MSPAEKMAAAKPPKTTGMRREPVLTCHLRQKRESMNLTLRDVEKGAKVSNAIVSEAERGCNVSMKTALKIAKFFGVAVVDLWPDLGKK